MKILIFGGTGFLGSYLCEELLKYNYDLNLYIRKNTSNLNSINKYHEKINIIWGEFSKEESFEKITQNIDYVYHLISPTNISKVEPILDINLIIKPTLKLMDACVKNKVKKIIFFSSGGAVYGIPQNIPIKENEKNNPISAYGLQKLIIEKYLSLYYKIYGLDYSILRIGNPYGPGQKPFSNQGIIANILGCYLTNKNIEIWGDGGVIRDYIYVTDVIKAARMILNYKGNQKIFNVAFGKGYSINQIINIVEDIFKVKLKINYLKGRKQDVPVNILNIDLLKEELNWHPEVSLNKGIEIMVNSWNEKNLLFNKY